MTDEIKPELKNFVDKVVVPALVRKYLRKLGSPEKSVASSEAVVAKCTDESMATSERDK